jgi:hypothetical protein
MLAHFGPGPGAGWLASLLSSPGLLPGFWRSPSRSPLRWMMTRLALSALRTEPVALPLRSAFLYSSITACSNHTASGSRQRAACAYWCPVRPQTPHIAACPRCFFYRYVV